MGRGTGIGATESVRRLGTGAGGGAGHAGGAAAARRAGGDVRRRAVVHLENLLRGGEGKKDRWGRGDAARGGKARRLGRGWVAKVRGVTGGGEGGWRGGEGGKKTMRLVGARRSHQAVKRFLGMRVRFGGPTCSAGGGSGREGADGGRGEERET